MVMINNENSKLNYKTQDINYVLGCLMFCAEEILKYEYHEIAKMILICIDEIKYSKIEGISHKNERH